MARRSEVSVPLEVPAERAPDRLELFGKNYKIGPKAGDWSYEMNAAISARTCGVFATASISPTS